MMDCIYHDKEKNIDQLCIQKKTMLFFWASDLMKPCVWFLKNGILRIARCISANDSPFQLQPLTMSPPYPWYHGHKNRQSQLVLNFDAWNRTVLTHMSSKSSFDAISHNVVLCPLIWPTCHCYAPNRSLSWDQALFYTHFDPQGDLKQGDGFI